MITITGTGKGNNKVWVPKPGATTIAVHCTNRFKMLSVSDDEEEEEEEETTSLCICTLVLYLLFA